MIDRLKPEVLAPAGSLESIYAAVRCGADGIYIGGKDFSARANAVNFSAEDMKAAADYCHLHGVKIYRAMNVVIFDSEAQHFCDEVKISAQIGIDGLIIQDLGGIYLAAHTVQNMPLHASTQMTIHTPLGAEFAKTLGLCRVVPARELSLEEIEKICSTGIETEVFVQGAQCMCISGQCYMSAMIGSRSANRGQCAQACRLPFTAEGKKHEEYYALSLKDMSVVRHTKELAKIGCASFKIEGRMKRPEYVAASVTALRDALDGTNSLDDDIKRLEAVFSRSGFTDGYLANNRTNMFGYRRKEDVTAANAVLPELALLYKNERKSAKISFRLTAHLNKDSSLDFFADKLEGKIIGKPAEAARNRSITDEDIHKQLSKLGDTHYQLDKIQCDIDDNIMLPASELNRMRREATAAADELIKKSNTPVYEISDDFSAKPCDYKSLGGSIKFRVMLSDLSVMKGLDYPQISLFILPLDTCEKYAADKDFRPDIAAALLPAFVKDEEKLLSRVKKLNADGITHFVCDNFTHMGVLSRLENIHIHANIGMNLTNSYSLLQCKNIGIEDAVISPEMKAAQINALKSPLPIGFYAYGAMPLMTVRCCPIKAQVGCAKCTHGLTDRTGRFFPVKCFGGYSRIFNCDVLETSDKLDDFKNASFAVIDADELDLQQAKAVINRYISREKPTGSFTRGLYYRGVI